VNACIFTTMDLYFVIRNCFFIFCIWNIIPATKFHYFTIASSHLFKKKQLWKNVFNSGLSTIPPISSKRTITFHLNSKDHNIWLWKYRSWLRTGTL